MAAGARDSIRIPLLLLAAADLALLIMRLPPLQKVLSLPGQGSTGIDPAVCLVGYMGLILWFTSASGSRMVSAQDRVTFLGVIGGAFMAAYFWLGGIPGGSVSSQVQIGFLAAGAVTWGTAGIRATRAAGSVGASLFAGIWSAMVSTLIACAVILGQYFVTGAPPETQDTYKQFQEIGIGTPSTVILIHALTAATGWLLLGPLVGGALAVLFGFFGRKREA